MKETIKNALKETQILPVINIKNKDCEKTLMDALCKTPIKSIEVLLRSDYAADAIKNIKAEYPDILVGAGTVMNEDDFYKAVSSGCDYIVSPGLDINLVKLCQREDIDIIPGCMTPSEIMSAKNMGLQVVKFFPAEIGGGVKALKLYESAFSGVLFLPTGGITYDNLESYLSLKNVIACGGSFMAGADLLRTGDEEKITENCLKALRIRNEAKK